MQPEAIQPDQADALVLALRRARPGLPTSMSDLDQVLTQIVATAVGTVPGVDADGMSGRHGYQSVLSTQLSLDGGTRAALNLYSRTANTFDESARITAGLFGLQAALLLYGANHVRHLGQALESRDLIGQAKGILMERFGVTSEQAFRMLVSSSQNTNIKLVEVARWLTEPGVHDPTTRVAAPGPGTAQGQGTRKSFGARHRPPAGVSTPRVGDVPGNVTDQGRGGPAGGRRGRS